MKHLKPLYEGKQLTATEYDKLKWSRNSRISRFNSREINLLTSTLGSYDFRQEKDDEEDRLFFENKKSRKFFTIDKITHDEKMTWLVYFSHFLETQIYSFDDFYAVITFLRKNSK